MRRWILTIIVLAAGVATSGLEAIPEEQFMLSFRSVSQSCVGAALSSKINLMEQFASEAFWQQLEVKSAVVNDFERVSIDYSRDMGLLFQKFFPSEPGGRRAENVSVGPSVWIPNCGGGGAPERSSHQQISQLVPDAKPGWKASFETISAEKSYQDIRVLFELLLPPSMKLDNFRQGQKISFAARVFAVSDPARTFARYRKDYNNTRTDLAVIAFLERVETETTMLSCAKGHSYAPSAGYRFCPIDGLPLK